MEILVSVIMPIYNAEKYLPMALDSVINQTLENIEIICVDDGSTDRSYEILQEYAAKDSRFIILQQENQYAGVARNNGMRVARGKYLSFLDADDYFDSTMLEKAYRCAEREQADVVTYGGRYFQVFLEDAYHTDVLLNEPFLPEGCSFKPNDNENHLFNFTNSATWNKLFKKSFVDATRLTFRACQRANDVYFVQMAIALAEKIGIVREDLVCYRTNNEESLQGTNEDTPMQFTTEFFEVQRELKNRDLYKAFGTSFRNLCLNHFIYALERMKTGKAFEELYTALKEKWFEIFHIIEADDYEFTNDYNTYAYERFLYMKNHTAVEYCMDRYSQIDGFRYLFPFHEIEKGDDIILYGAGRVGREFYRQLQKTKYCKIVSWADQKAAALRDERIIAPKQVNWSAGKYVIIAIEKETIVEEVKRELIETYLLTPEKVIWCNPRLSE